MILPLLLFASIQSNFICGKIVDPSDGLPLCNAMVYTTTDTVYTNPDGSFQMKVGNEKVFVEALGFQKKELSFSQTGSTIYLEPLSPIGVVFKKKK